MAGASCFGAGALAARALASLRSGFLLTCLGGSVTRPQWVRVVACKGVRAVKLAGACRASLVPGLGSGWGRDGVGMGFRVRFGLFRA